MFFLQSTDHRPVFFPPGLPGVRQIGNARQIDLTAIIFDDRGPCAPAKASRKSRGTRNCPRSPAVKDGGESSPDMEALLNSHDHPHRLKKYK
jgi:hypothetical protein